MFQAKSPLFFSNLSHFNQFQKKKKMEKKYNFKYTFYNQYI